MAFFNVKAEKVKTPGQTKASGQGEKLTKPDDIKAALMAMARPGKGGR